MIDPSFPRKFSFDRPAGGPLLFTQTSAWNRPAGRLMPMDVALRQLGATYSMLRELSVQSLADDQNKKQQMEQNGSQGSSEFKDLTERIQRETASLATEGGMAQFPFINHDDYSFPIFAVKRDNGEVSTRRLSMRSYEGQSFAPPWLPRAGNADQGWEALEVPLPACSMRPSGPLGSHSDGAIILYDKPSGIEYNFWQVATLPGADGKFGGGIVGCQMVSAGSVSAFDTRGWGARTPEFDPSGSSRATGLPYLGGLLLPEDFASGVNSRIEHALAFTLPHLRHDAKRNDPPRWVYPATRTEFEHPTSDADALAAGQRIALNSTLYLRGGRQVPLQQVMSDASVPAVVRIFLEALRTYGAFLVDASGGFGLAAEDIHTANPRLSPSEIQELLATDSQPAPSLDAGKTSWQILMETINEYLSWHLLDSGLALGFMIGQEFRSNFVVVEDLAPHYFSASNSPA